MRVARHTLGGLVASWVLLFAEVRRATATTSDGCAIEETACRDNAECLACNTWFADTEDVIRDECSDRYSASFWTGSEGASAGFCETTGATYCCAFETNAAAEECLTNAVTVSYWDCLVADIGCVLDDMPCYTGDIVLTSESTTDSSIGTDSFTPSPSAGTSPTSSTPFQTSSSYSSDSLLPTSVECAAEEAACQENAVCLACSSGAESSVSCTSRYPDVWEYRGEGLYASFCDSSGATSCCDFEDNDTAEECMTNPATVAYWGCIMADVGCSIFNMPCYSSDITTPAPSSTTATTAPFDSEITMPAPTPTTTATTAPGVVDTDTSANGAARTLSYSSSAAWATGLLATTVGVLV